MFCTQEMATFEEAASAYDIAGIHPACASLPAMSDDSFNGLCQSINKYGIEVPISLTHQGLLIDGKHRLKACYITGAMPEFDRLPKDYSDEYPQFAERMNTHRRHIGGQSGIIQSGARSAVYALILGAAKNKPTFSYLVKNLSRSENGISLDDARRTIGLMVADLEIEVDENGGFYVR